MPPGVVAQHHLPIISILPAHRTMAIQVQFQICEWMDRLQPAIFSPRAGYYLGVVAVAESYGDLSTCPSASDLGGPWLQSGRWPVIRSLSPDIQSPGVLVEAKPSSSCLRMHRCQGIEGNVQV